MEKKGRERLKRPPGKGGQQCGYELGKGCDGKNAASLKCCGAVQVGESSTANRLGSCHEVKPGWSAEPGGKQTNSSSDAAWVRQLALASQLQAAMLLLIQGLLAVSARNRSSACAAVGRCLGSEATHCSISSSTACINVAVSEVVSRGTEPAAAAQELYAYGACSSPHIALAHPHTCAPLSNQHTPPLTCGHSCGTWGRRHSPRLTTTARVVSWISSRPNEYLGRRRGWAAGWESRCATTGAGNLTGRELNSSRKPAVVATAVLLVLQAESSARRHTATGSLPSSLRLTCRRGRSSARPAAARGLQREGEGGTGRDRGGLSTQAGTLSCQLSAKGRRSGLRQCLQQGVCQACVKSRSKAKKHPACTTPSHLHGASGSPPRCARSAPPLEPHQSR